MKSLIVPVLMAGALVAMAAVPVAAGCHGGCGGGWQGIGAGYGSCNHADSLWTGYCMRPDWPVAHMGGCGGCGCGGGCGGWWYGGGMQPCGLGRCCGCGCGDPCGGCGCGMRGFGGGLFRRHRLGFGGCCDTGCGCGCDGYGMANYGSFPATNFSTNLGSGCGNAAAPAAGGSTHMKAPTEAGAESVGAPQQAEPQPAAGDSANNGVFYNTAPTSIGTGTNAPQFDNNNTNSEPPRTFDGFQGAPVPNQFPAGNSFNGTEFNNSTTGDGA